MVKTLKRILLPTLFFLTINVLVFSQTQPIITNVSSPSTDLAVQQDTTTPSNSNSKKLDEVVVTALGLKREQKSLGYAVSQIGGDATNTVKDANFINSLSGKIAGVSIQASNAIGGSSNIVLRGYKSLTGNNQALFVIDGVPIDNTNNSSNATNTSQATGGGGYDFGNAAANINPDDIESISVLKGAAASALYGSRASNGVVMITTKKAGKSDKENLSISNIFYNVSYMAGLVNPQTLPTYQKQYGAGYGASYGDNYDDTKDIYPGIGNSSDLNWQGNFFNYGNGPAGGSGVRAPYVPYIEDASMGGRFNPNLQVYDWKAWIPGTPYYGKTTAWVYPKNDFHYFFQLSNTIDNNVGFEGGNKYGSFRMSYTNFYQTGYLPNNTLQRNTINVSGSYNVTNKLTATALFNYINTVSAGNSISGYSDNVMTSIREWAQTNVDWKQLKDIYFATRKNYSWNLPSADPATISSLYPPIYWDNPYFSAYENTPKMQENRFFGNVSLNYKILDWLTAMGRVGYDVYSQLVESKTAISSNPTPYYSRYNNNFSEYNYDAYLTATKDWGKFDINGVLGTNIRVNNRSSIYATTNGGLVTPGFYALANTLNALSPPIEVATQRIVYGYYATVSMGWDDYLYLDLAGRVDKSSTLPIKNNTYFYPSVSASFVFSKFLTPVAPWISFGKIRANYAEVGSDAPFSILNNYYTANTSRSGQPVSPNPLFGTVPMQSTYTYNFNANLKPENTRSYEFGLEMQFFNNRLGFDVSYYRSNTFNQILPLAVSYSTGYLFNYINGGQVRNQGVEASITAVPVKAKDFAWQTSFNIYKNWNTIVSLYTDPSGKAVTNYQLATFQGGVSLNAAVGRPYGELRGKTYVYYNGQKVVKSNGYYEINNNANNVIGNIQPDFKGGWSNTFTYKNWSLSFLIDFQAGGNLYSLDMYYGLSTGIYPESAGLNDKGNPVRNEVISENDANYSKTGGLILPGVVKQTDGTYKPNTKRIDAGNNTTGFYVGGYSGNPNKAFIYDASYVKLREVSISYSIPKQYLSATKFIKSCAISLIGKNLWIIYKNLPYSDPEALLASGNIQGYQVGALPSLIQFGAKVNITF